MGSGLSLQENQRVEYQSGAGRLCNSILVAICVAPLLILGMCGLLGWNERRAVCDQKAITSGEDAVMQVGCSDGSAGSGSLVLFSCDIATSSLPMMHLSSSDFAGVQVQGTGLRVASEMYQCVESDQSRTEKTSGGGTRTIHTYTYHREWSSTPIDSSSFHAIHSDNFRMNCGQMNPSWGASIPSSGSIYAPQMAVGAFSTTMTSKVPLNTPITGSARPPSGWSQTGTGSFYKGKDVSRPTIGDVKVTLYSNDPNSLRATVLGENSNGQITKWGAPSSWLCSGFSLSDLRMGTLSKAQLFDMLASEANVLTWILRAVGFGLMWLAFCLCFGPLEVAGDCIPCIGPCIGDSIHAISCCVACLPATACTLGIVGVVWVAMRPMVGIPLMLLNLAIMAGLGYYIAKTRAAKQGGRVIMVGENPDTGATGLLPGTAAQAPAAAVTVAMAQAYPQPQVQATQRQMQVQVPAGFGPGQLIQFQTPDGSMMQATVPQGVAPGGIFMVNY